MDTAECSPDGHSEQGVDIVDNLKFFITKVNGKYAEYDSVEISMKDLNRLDGVEEAIQKAEDKIKSEQYRGGECNRLEVVSILYSGNDMVYINYDSYYKISYESNIQDGTTESMFYDHAIFRIRNGRLEYEGIEEGRRPLKSSFGLESYISEYPY